MAVYNAELFLREAIDSILSQSFQCFEFIIVNDGSTDRSREILARYKDSRIVVIDNGQNRGLIYSLNKGLERSRGKYIARMDADDIALPERLRMQFDYLESHPETGICGSATEPFYDNEKRGKNIRFPESDVAIRAFAFFQSPFCHPTVMMRKEILDTYHLEYPTDCRHAEDYGLWIELLKYTKGANLPTVLLRYRRHEQSVTMALSKDVEESNRLVSKVQTKYWAQHKIGLDPTAHRTFFHFLNRSIPMELSAETQQEVEHSLRQFLHQLPEGEMKRDILHYLSEICFFRFFTHRRLPKGTSLRRFSLKGARIYCKKVINRIITKDK